MIPRRITGATHNLEAPKDWDQTKIGKCSGLWVRVEEHSVVASAWEPTPEELRLLNEGGSVVIRIVGGQPPIKLTVEPSA